jgi:hypothetical protein
VIADRLRELEGHGVITRRTLPPPAASSVYELTAWGQDLKPILLAVGNWGIGIPLPPTPVTLSATSMLLFLWTSARVDPREAPMVCRLKLHDRVFAVRVEDGHVHVQAGDPTMPDVSLRTDPWTLNTLLDDPSKLDLAVSEGTAAVEGDWSALRRLLETVVDPAPAAL